MPPSGVGPSTGSSRHSGGFTGPCAEQAGLRRGREGSARQVPAEGPELQASTAAQHVGVAGLFGRTWLSLFKGGMKSGPWHWGNGVPGPNLA